MGGDPNDPAVVIPVANVTDMEGRGVMFVLYRTAIPSMPQHSNDLPEHGVHESRSLRNAFLLVIGTTSVPQLHVSPTSRQRGLLTVRDAKHPR
jgi:hypothetical protein